MHKTCIYSKKIVVGEKRPNVHILKKNHLCQSVPHRAWNVCFFEYMQAWWLFRMIFCIFFEYMQVLCTFGIKMLIVFEYMQGWWTSSLSNLHFSNLKTKTQNSYTWYVFLVLKYSWWKKHKMLIYKEILSTTSKMIIDTFKKGIKHKKWFGRHCKACCTDPNITLQWKQITKSLDM